MCRNVYFWVLFLCTILSTRTQAFEAPGATVRFVENKGQWPAEVLFRAELPGGLLFLKKNSLHYVFYDSQALDDIHTGSPAVATGPAVPAARVGAPVVAGEPPIRGHGVEMRIENSLPSVQVQSKNLISSHHNFFLGSDPSRWASGVSSFGEVIYRGIYPGIDLRVFAYYQTLKYEFLVRPGADPSVIRLLYEGATSVTKEQDQLVIGTSLLPFREAKPYCFTEKNGKPTEVPSAWKVNGRTASFDLPNGYDTSLPLTIDPSLIFSTYSGSTSDNWGHTATYDAEGNLYTAGVVFGAGLNPTTGAFQTKFGGELDVSVLKFSPDGRQLLYAAYLGGTTGETPHSLIVNSKNELLIYGVTSSDNFPVTGGYSRKFSGGSQYIPVGNTAPEPGSSLIQSIYFKTGTDLFVARISPDGKTLRSSTYLGGTGNDGINDARQYLTISNYGDDLRGEIVVDQNDNVFVATVTYSSDFPVTANAPQNRRQGPADAVLIQLNPDLSQLVWSTYFGGTGYDVAFALRRGNSGAIYAVGVTRSSDLPGTAGALKPALGGSEDGFLVKFSGNRLERATYLGTEAEDAAYLIDLDAEENPHVFGLTRGRYPVSGQVYQNAGSGQFIHALDAGLGRTVFSTVVGSGRGMPDISPTAFLVNECGNMYLSGWGGAVNARSGHAGTSTAGLPTTAGAYRTTTDGSNYWIGLLEQGAKSLLYGTFFGSEGANLRGDHVDGGTSRFDKSGVIYHAACACGGTFIPATPQAWSPTNRSNNCNNAAFKFDIDRLKAAFDAFQGGQKDKIEGCLPLTLNFVNTSEGGKNYEWDFGGTGTSTSGGQVSHTFDKPGEYTVKLTAYNPLTCKRVDVAQKVVKVFPADFRINSDTTICAEKPVQLLASGGKTYEWTPVQGLSSATVANPIVKPTKTTTYTVKMTNEFGCTAQKSVTVKTDDSYRPTAAVRIGSECGQPMKLELGNQTSGADSYQWSMGNGDTLRTNPPGTYQYPQSGSYEIIVTARKGACTLSVSVPVEVENLSEIPNVVTANNDGKNDVFVVGFAGAKLEIFNRWGKPIYRSDNYANDWGRDVPDGLYYYLLTTPRGTKCKGWVEVLE
ncbi:DUF7948 domain-containing protein [Larkinella soli]|uniref:DUF7948 domain-containing protein n=1 Tax=Larkinella soli TaxID=1770527 RepID=UPI000FFB75A0|nr:gliding motility-associated C-terminal domain-containing protein [Larkinella soli]